MKRGQLDFPIIPFVAGVIILIVLGPMLYRLLSETKTGLDNTLGNSNSTIIGSDEAKNISDSVFNTGTRYLDELIIASFVILLCILFISAFLIDSSPFWIILYILVCLMLMVVAPFTVDSLRQLYLPGAILDTTQLNNFNYVLVLIDNFGKFLAIIMAITGIIIYGKIGGSGSGSR